MVSSALTCAVFCLWLSCRAMAVVFNQSPPLIVDQGRRVSINCSHDDSSLIVMLWYQHQTDPRSMTLIGYGYVNSPSYEGQFEKQFTMERQSTVSGSLIVQKTNLLHSAVYFCAAIQGNANEAYFGKGTKLTVLEPRREVTIPEVKLLQPSPNECRNKKDEARKKTLVCLAYDFYPDHVTVSWQVNGDNITVGVATDSAPKRNGKYYSISSRLRVSSDVWHNPKNVFKCIVHFFNGTHTPEYSDEIYGIESSTGGESAEAGIPREEYVKVTQNAKLSFTVLIFKGLVYGVFVAFLIWKLQGSSGKQSS